jgi:hypothetical protein
MGCPRGGGRFGLMARVGGGMPVLLDGKDRERISRGDRGAPRGAARGDRRVRAVGAALYEGHDRTRRGSRGFIASIARALGVKRWDECQAFHLRYSKLRIRRNAARPRYRLGVLGLRGTIDRTSRSI